VNQVLDPMSLSTLQAKAVRRARATTRCRWTVHVRRMLMMTNPVVLVRRMLDSERAFGLDGKGNHQRRRDVKEGDKSPRPSRRTAFRRDTLVHATHQRQSDELHDQLYRHDSNSGILLPLAYETRLSYRNVDYVKLYVDAYQLDLTLPNLAAPDAVRSSPEPPSYPVPMITSQRIGKGVWRVDQGGTTVVEFRDHIVLFELGVNVMTARAVIAHARTLAPGKPVTHLITSHNHFDHTRGCAGCRRRADDRAAGAAAAAHGHGGARGA
jgi:hypothetical protein